MEAARLAVEELGAELSVIKKSSEEYGRDENPPPCPSVAVDGRFIASNGTVTYEDLKKALEESEYR